MMAGHSAQYRSGVLKMRKRLISLMIVMMACLTFAGSTLALGADDIVVQPRSSVTVTCGLSKSGSQYKVWSKTQVSFSGDLAASVSLYQVINGSEVFITSASASATGTTVTASKLRTLSSGTYKVYGSGTSGSSSGSKSSTITIP